MNMLVKDICNVYKQTDGFIRIFTTTDHLIDIQKAKEQYGNEIVKEMSCYQYGNHPPVLEVRI